MPAVCSGITFQSTGASQWSLSSGWSRLPARVPWSCPVQSAFLNVAY